MDEFAIIKKYFSPLTNKISAARNLEDDVAKISCKTNEEIILSKDIFVEDIHFTKADGAYNIASKLLRTNLSDLASSGAKPLYYMLGFSFTKNLDEKFIADFCSGLKNVSKKYKLSLIGGDSISSPDRLFFSITIFGIKNKKDGNLNRNSAKNEDLIFVSGTIGDAFLGLQITKNKIKSNDYLLARHFSPTPRIELGMELAKQKIAGAAIDVSDGLLSDLNHICQSSKLDAIIHQNKIPFSLEAKKILKENNFTIADLISGGDDYELIFSANKKYLDKIEKLSKKLKTPISCIGQFKKSKTSLPKLTLLNVKNQEVPISKYGYQH
jgi:thiamine-monophosphate kinase